MITLALVSFALLAQTDGGPWPLPVPQPAPVKAGRPNDATVAWLVVTRAADIKPGELVLVTGGQQDRALLEALALYVQKAGAHPVLQVESESLERNSLLEVPAAADSSIAAGAAKLWGALDTVLTVPHVERLDYLSTVPAERRSSRTAALLKLEELANRRAVKRVELGNGIYPTEENARRLGISRPALTTAFYSAVAVDPAALATEGAKVARVLQTGKAVRLTHPNGTDLKLALAGRAPTVSDGALSPDEVKQGGAKTLSWLPAGEVYVAPAPGTAEGTVVVNRAYYLGNEISGLRLTFKAGRLTSMSAQKGLGPLEAAFAAEKDPRKGDFAFLDIGLNPMLEAEKILTFTSRGMVTVGFGNNLWAGGENNVPFEVGGCYLPGATLTVDGKPLVKDGKVLSN